MEHIINGHNEASDHEVPLDHLRALYFRPPLGSGVLLPTPVPSTSSSSFQPSAPLPPPPSNQQPSHFETSRLLSSPAIESSSAVTSGGSSPSGGGGWSRHGRSDSNNTASQSSRTAASAFWTQYAANAHPESHISIHASAQSQTQSAMQRHSNGRRSSVSTPSTSHRRALSYIHATPGSLASTIGIGIDQIPGLGLGQALPSPSSTSYGYLPTRVLPVGEKKRILVTGGAGFVGSHLVDRLMLMGHEVLVLDNFFTGQKSNVSQWSGHPNFEMIRHDVVNPLHVEIDQIYHLACPASPISYQANQIKTIKTNFMGTLNTLGLAKRTKARFLLASTSEVYGDPDVHPQPETYHGNVNPTGPRACYDEGKRVAETLTYGYYYQDGVEVRVARIFNTYGPRMHPHDGRVVSNFILQALRGEPLTVFGDGKQTRSFCFIHDLIDGLIALMNAEPPETDESMPSELSNPRRALTPRSTTTTASASEILSGATDSIVASTSGSALNGTVAQQSETSLDASSGSAPTDVPEDVHRFDVHSPVNLGNPGEFTIIELVELVRKCVQQVKAQDPDYFATTEDLVEIQYLAMPKDDPKQRKPDITRATNLLNWYPKWKLQDGLHEMTRWYWERIKEGSM